MGSKGWWHSDESTCLPPTWLGFKSRCQQHMWAGFVVANLSFTLRDFSLATLFSPLFKNHHFHVVPNSNLTSWNSRQRTWLRGYATSEKIIIYYVWEHKAIRLCYWVICWPDDQVQKLWHGYGCFGNHNNLWTNLGCNLYFNQTFIMVSMKQNFGSILHFCSSLRPNIFLTPRF